MQWKRFYMTATPDLLTGNYLTVPKLLRAIANGLDAQRNGQHTVLKIAADMIDDAEKVLTILEDVPGATPSDKAQKLKEYYLGLQEQMLRQADGQ